ncbi:hypothetical protein OM189_21245 [Escherichia albertii]|nr:hypothetical protein [Escherichia albertii]
MTTITRENAEIKSFITGFLSDPAHDNQSTDSLLSKNYSIDGIICDISDLDRSAFTSVVTREQYEAARIASQKVKSESKAYKLDFEQWLEQQRGEIDVDCGCVSAETFMHWLRVAYEAGNHPVLPDSSQQAPRKSVKTTLERGYLEAALKIKPGHTLGVIDAMLVHEMAKALLPLVADKHEAGHANESRVTGSRRDS